MVDHLMALWAYHHAHGPKRIMVHIEAAITERDEAVARINELENELERVKSRVDGAEIAQVGWKERAEKVEVERNRARVLIRKALQVGRMHASEYAWEALVEGADAALADEVEQR